MFSMLLVFQYLISEATNMLWMKDIVKEFRRL